MTGMFCLTFRVLAPRGHTITLMDIPGYVAVPPPMGHAVLFVTGKHGPWDSYPQDDPLGFADPVPLAKDKFSDIR